MRSPINRANVEPLLDRIGDLLGRADEIEVEAAPVDQLIRVCQIMRHVSAITPDPFGLIDPKLLSLVQ
jgi:hypothetical protein